MKALNTYTSETLPYYFNKVDKHKGINFINGSTEETFLTYRELWKESLIALKNLQDLKVPEGAEVIFQIHTNKHFLIAFWACIIGRYIPVPLSVSRANNRDQRLLSVWNILNNPYLITDTERPYAALLDTKDRKIINVQQLQENNGRGSPCTIDKNDIAYIQFSSGSSGNPKGVTLTHKNICINALDILSCSGASAEDSSLCWMPLTHDMGMIGFHITSLIGAMNQHIIPTEVFIRRPELWMAKASQHKVTTLYSPNFGFKYFLSALREGVNPDWDISSIRIIYNGAEPIAHSLCDTFIKRLSKYGLRNNCILTVYGLAEASVAVSIPRTGTIVRSHNLDRRYLAKGEKVNFLASSAPGKAANFVMVGYPIPHCQVRIAWQDRVLNDDYIGEIQIKGENVTKGYYNNPRETQNLFTEDDWLKTGDTGFMHNGELIIIGRSKNTIIVNGQNYYPHDIEKMTHTIEGIEFGKIAFCGVWEPLSQNDSVIGFVLFRKNAEAFLPLLRSIKKELLVRIGIRVDKLIPVKRIPKTTSGKIQYFKLKNDYQNGLFNDVIARVDQLLNVTATKELNVRDQVCQIIKSVSGTPEINFNDSLFGLGVNSLQALEFCSRINTVLGVNIDIADVLMHNTINAIINALEKHRETPAHRIESVENFNAVLPIQRRFWLLHQLDDADSMLHITTSVQLMGVVNEKYLQQAFKAVLKRHESLRYAFIMENGVLRTKLSDIQPGTGFLFADSVSDPEGAPDRIHTVCSLKFDIENGPLYRLILHRRSPEKYELILQLHHLIADGWSVKVLLSDLLNAYNGIAKGKHPDEILPVLPFQFRDYVHWTENTIKTTPAHKTYWKKELENIRDLSELPFIKKASHTIALRSQQVAIEVSDHLSKALTSYAERCNVSVYTTLVACVNMLLYKYSSQPVQLISVVSSGRSNAAFIDQVGCYIKLLPLVIAIDPLKSVTETVLNVKDKLLSGLKHEVYSHDRLKEATTGSSGEQIKLPDVTVLMQDFDTILERNTYSGAFRLGEVKQTNEGAVSKMQFEFIVHHGKLSIKLNYNKELFYESDMKKVLLHFNTLLTSVLEAPDTPVKAHSFLSEEEERQLLSFSRPLPFDIPAESVIELFDNQVDKSPDTVAIVYNNARFTYRELQQYSYKVGHFLVNTWTIGSGDVVALAMERSQFLIVSMLSILRSGASYLPVDTTYPGERVQHMLEISGAAHLLLDTPAHALYSRLLLHKKTAIVTEILNQDQDRDVAFTANNYPSLNATAYIIFTSGTTGFPKGMRISHRALADYVKTFSSYFDLSEEDAVVQQASIAFDTIVEEIFPVLISGGKLVVSEKGGQYIDELTQLMKSENVSVLSTTPTVINALNALDETPNLRILISGGDELKPFHIDKLVDHMAVYNTYGPSESTVCATFNRLNTVHEANIIGTPVKNRIVLLLNSDKQFVPVGCAGELYIGGTGLTDGYLDTEEDTGFLNSTYFNGERLYRSGDLGKWLPDGKILFCGRKDNQLKINGYRIEVEDIENNLRRINSIDDAVVIGKQNTKGTRSLVAFYVSGKEISSHEFREFLADKIPFFMIPSRFVKRDRLPVTPNGKIDRRALGSIEISEGDPIVDKPGNDIEKQLLTLWRKEFDTDRIGLHSNFFELGGHSIIAVHLINKMNQAFNTQISLREFFTAPSIYELSNTIQKSTHKIYTPIQPAARKAYYDLTPSQKGIWLLNEVEGDTVGYNIFGAFELLGPLDVEILQKTFVLIVKRHDSLRTNFVEIEGDPKQQVNIYEEEFFNIQMVDLKNDPDQEARMFQIMEQQRSFKFNLEQWPLINVALVRMDDRSAVLSVCMHHLAADGISASILIDEFLQIYKSLNTKEDTLLAPPKIQYKDYVEWLLHSLNTKALNLHKNYWLHKLREPRQVVNLPLDYPRPSYKSYDGSQVEWWIDPEKTIKLNRLFRQHKATFYSGLLTLVKILLFKYTANEDIIIGGPGIGRHHEDLTRQIGCFVNTLIVRSRIKGGYNFAEALQQVQNNVIESYDHSEYPFEMIVNDLDAKRDLGRSPLFDIRFIYDDGELQTRNFEEATMVTEALKMKKVSVPVTRSIYDITFSFARKDNIKVIIEFNNRLFDRETIGLLSMRLEKLIDIILNNDSVALDEINLEIPVKNQSIPEEQFNVKEAF